MISHSNFGQIKSSTAKRGFFQQLFSLILSRPRRLVLRAGLEIIFVMNSRSFSYATIPNILKVELQKLLMQIVSIKKFQVL